MKKTRPPPFIPLWEKVAVGGLRPPFFNRTPMLCIGCAKSVPDEGSFFESKCPTPHPSAMLRIAATLSHKGRGEQAYTLSRQQKGPGRQRGPLLVAARKP